MADVLGHVFDMLHCMVSACSLRSPRDQSSRALLTRQRGHSSSTPNSYTHLSLEGGGEDRWVSPDVAEHVRLMHEITWGPVVSVFSEVRGLPMLLMLMGRPSTAGLGYGPSMALAGCVRPMFAQFLFGDECAQLCDRGGSHGCCGM